MKIFSAGQIKNWDAFTISHEPVTPGELMERAAKACFGWIVQNQVSDKTVKVFCGKGNNGGDGLVIARMLLESTRDVSVYIPDSPLHGSADFENNLSALRACTDKIFVFERDKDFPVINCEELVIDALFGTGLNTAPDKLISSLISYINNSRAEVIAIDIPSGLYADKSSQGNEIIKATCTLTFQLPKLAFFMAENEGYIGQVVVLDISLHPAFYMQETAAHEILELPDIQKIFRPRKPFSNKGNYGHAMLIAGSYGMMGAAVLAANACLKSGSGKLTCLVCERGYEVMQISAPEAMCQVSGDRYITKCEPADFDCVGIGPGIGQHASHPHLLNDLFSGYSKPVVIDADALNVIAGNKTLLSSIPPGSILTPHPKEFDRLFGKSANDFERMNVALEKSAEYKIYIVVKGHHTLITTPLLQAYFNSTGNPGMAKAGSGDVLTGVLTGLAAQGYSPLEVCMMGVYLHGLAGDLAAETFSQESMVAGDIIDCLGSAFKKIA